MMLRGGAVAWMAKNKVASNLLMLFLLVGGIFMMLNTKQEVFPDSEKDIINITFEYTGASPSEIEEGMVLPTEDAVSSLHFVNKITSVAGEGSGSVSIELIKGMDRQQALQDVKSEVDKISTYPDEAETPDVELEIRRREVLTVSVYGDVNEEALRFYADRIKNGLLATEGITQLEYVAVKDREIAVWIPEETLRKYSLTLRDVSDALRGNSMDYPSGTLETESGDIKLRMYDKRRIGSEFGSIPVVSSAGGGTVLLGDIAEISDGFEEQDILERFNGAPSISIDVYRVGKQTPASVSERVHETIDKITASFPESVKVVIWDDRSEQLQNRIDLLMKNAAFGLSLVVLILAVFLETRVALWVALGIPISVFGSFYFLNLAGASINMITTFAFIMTLGIAVDDAIVVGENIHTHYKSGKTRYRAAVDGTKEMLSAVTFSVLTTVATFAPLLFVEGSMGLLMNTLPVVVISVLLVSLMESFFILPAHMNSGRERDAKPKFSLGIRDGIRNALDRFVNGPFDRFLRMTMEYKYATVAVFIAITIIFAGIVGSGNLKFRFMAPLEGDRVRATAVMPTGTAAAVTERVVKRLEETAFKVDAEMMRETGSDTGFIEYVNSGIRRDGSAVVNVMLYEYEIRNFRTGLFEEKWREAVGSISSAESLSFDSQLRNFGANISVRLDHDNEEVLREASGIIKHKLAEYGGVYDIEDSFASKQQEIHYRLNGYGRSLGLTNETIASQVSPAFLGIKSLIYQRGQDEVTVRVKYPYSGRKYLGDVYAVNIKTPSGSEVPLSSVAEVYFTEDLTEINRTNRRRVVNVIATAGVFSNPQEIMRDLAENTMPEVQSLFPGLEWKFEGQEESRRESMDSLKYNMTFAVLIVYALLAVPLASYVQPLIIMFSIPLGLVGAAAGHMLLGLTLSLMSIFGMVAVSGVVVNNSLVLVDFINRFGRDKGYVNDEIIMEGAKRRFRPIIMTSLTTFFGLAPMILETSIHVQFLIPMAVSIAFGVLFTTIVALLFVPSAYSIMEDCKRLIDKKQ
ncbi:efflux RND transporter permease subunit [Geovibrio thiophilus]|uniref:Efflux RND transporter permease subunit n=1 Tax=Geovibrio thiophilus TaxID=139438 RepID=A0A3R5XXI9_9BACT|nr:efflux RND transporter permease subunit [Geovibrio thiophilus]QAR33665.1 efflux RND transporter permease subunit [Geovibrio thiophilus]